MGEGMECGCKGNQGHQGSCGGAHGECGGSCEQGMGTFCLIKHAMMKAVVMALAERIKIRLDRQLGDKLDSIADLTVEGMMAKKKAKLEMCKQKHELKERLHEILFGEEEGE